MRISGFVFLFLFSVQLFSQQKDSIPAEEDFSQYADVEVATSTIVVKKYCSQKIIGLSPAKLISAGYDFVFKNKLTADTLGNFLGNVDTIYNNYGVRFAANFPVISNNKLILNLGVNYLDFKYSFERPINNVHPLNYNLATYGLRSYGLNGTLFKPLNEKQFLIIQAQGDWNGDFKMNELPAGNSLKISGAAIYGFKPHDRRQYGFGVTRTYRAGEVNYIPVFLYNYTFQNRKMGFEMLLPARANFRYTINSRNMLFAGFELEGNSYFLKNIEKNYNFGLYNNVQLRRSEIRPRLTYEFSVYKFIWASVQVGYRLNYRFNIDDGEYYRAFGDEPPYLMNNSVSGAPYFNVSINLVSP